MIASNLMLLFAIFTLMGVISPRVGFLFIFIYLFCLAVTTGQLILPVIN